MIEDILGESRLKNLEEILIRRIKEYYLMLFVQNAANHARFHSSQQMGSRFCVLIVLVQKEIIIFSLEGEIEEIEIQKL